MLEGNYELPRSSEDRLGATDLKDVDVSEDASTNTIKLSGRFIQRRQRIAPEMSRKLVLGRAR
jgi:hypothetical protein